MRLLLQLCLVRRFKPITFGMKREICIEVHPLSPATLIRCYVWTEPIRVPAGSKPHPYPPLLPLSICTLLKFQARLRMLICYCVNYLNPGFPPQTLPCSVIHSSTPHAFTAIR